MRVTTNTPAFDIVALEYTLSLLCGRKISIGDNASFFDVFDLSKLHFSKRAKRKVHDIMKSVIAELE